LINSDYRAAPVVRCIQTLLTCSVFVVFAVTF